MRLGTKIFLAFSIILFALLGTIQYVTTIQTEAFEVDRITGQLRTASSRFDTRLTEQREATYRLVRTITSDQKYRAFLQQIKENFFPFAEEIAIDTGSDYVLMLDADMTVRGVSPPDRRDLAMEDHVARLSEISRARHLQAIFRRVLATGRGASQIVAFGDGLANASFVPLKESRRDDYALGIVMTARSIDDRWVRDFLEDDIEEFGIVFFAGDRALASDETPRVRETLLLGRSDAADNIGRVALGGERHLVLTHRFADAGVDAGYVVAANLDQRLAPSAAMQNTILYIGAGVLVIGLLLTLTVAGGIVRPLRRLVEGTQRVADGDYSFRIDTHSKDEVGELSTSFQKMVTGLKEKEEIRNLFGKYVHPAIVSDLLQHPESIATGGTLRVQSLLFSDLPDFVGISSTMKAPELVTFLNTYLGAMTEEVTRSDGILDKYLGDGIMAFFGPPFTPGNHAVASCMAALRMRRRLQALIAEDALRASPGLRMRVGIATGEVVVGNIGSDYMRDYTCIGEAVNLASRLESVNKHYGTEIIVDAGTREMAGRAVAVREIDTVRVIGSDLPLRIYELLELAGDEGPEVAAIAERYAAMLAHYRAGRFDRAADGFEELARPPFYDPPSRVMAARCRSMMTDAVENWDGVFEMAEK